jgi:hypothetical protein
MLHAIAYALWIAAFLLQVAITVRIIARGLFRDYPLFLAYSIKHILSFLTLFFLYQYGRMVWYRHFYMGWEMLDVLLKFGMIGELLAHIFASYKSIREWGTTIVRGTSVVLVLAAVIVAAFSDLADPQNFLSRFFALERSAEIVQAGLLFLLLGFCYALGLRWKQPSLGIAFGLCVITCVNLAVFSLRAGLGGSRDPLLSLATSVGYDLGALAWLITLYTNPRTVRSLARSTVPAWDVASWNQALMELLRR